MGDGPVVDGEAVRRGRGDEVAVAVVGDGREEEELTGP